MTGHLSLLDKNWRRWVFLLSKKWQEKILLQMIVILPVCWLQTRGLLSCRGVGTGVLERAGSWHVNAALPAFGWSKIRFCMCVTEVRAAVDVAEEEEEEGFEAVKEVQHAHAARDLVS